MNKGNELVLLGTLKITMSNFLANFIYSDAISSFNAKALRIGVSKYIKLKNIK